MYKNMSGMQKDEADDRILVKYRYISKCNK